MNDLFEELAGIIETEIAVQQKTLAKLNEQQQILVRYSMDSLEDNLKDLDALHPEVKALDKARCVIKEQVAGALKDADAPIKARLAGLEECLIKTAKSVRTVSRQNMMLIRQAMDLNYELMRQIHGGEIDRVSTYGQAGELLSSSGTKIVDANL
jgi:hypothetical protein